MAGNDEDRFRIKPAAPKSRGGPRSQRFVSQVLKQVSKTGAKSASKSLGRPANTFGRGRVASTVAGQRLGPNARRVVIKSRFVVLRRASPNSAAVHLRYIERDGVTRDGQKGQAYGADTDMADLKAFQERGQNDRHQFRFIVSAEDGLELEDLKGFTRQLMRQMEIDLETRLDWVAVDHWDTDNPHTHIVLHGHTGGPASGREDLVIAPDYMAHGMRLRASEIVTEWLGLRTDADMRRSHMRQVDQHRLTVLDRALVRQSVADSVDLTGSSQDMQLQNALRARLQRLEGMGLTERIDANRWKLQPAMAAVLSSMGQREDALELIRRALKGQPRECVIEEQPTRVVIGRIAGKGLIDELWDSGYLVIDGVDGKAHFLKLPTGIDLTEFPVQGLVEAKPLAQERAVDRHIRTLARGGLYEPAAVLEHLKSGSHPDPEFTVAAHLRRLEALRRIGLVERVGSGSWYLSSKHLERAHAHDEQRTSGIAIELRSHMSIDQQVRALGATWLDKQLLKGEKDLAMSGFGLKVRDAMNARLSFLSEQGLASRHGQQLRLPRNLLATLRESELAAAASEIERGITRTYSPAQIGDTVSGVYTRSVQLSSGRFALLDDGKSFTLVPWKPVIEKRLGQHLSASIHSHSIAWSLGRSRSVSI